MHHMRRTNNIITALSIILACAHAQSPAYDEAVAKDMLAYASAAYCPETNIDQWNCNSCKSRSDFRVYLRVESPLLGFNITSFIGIDDQRKQIIVGFEGSQSYVEVYQEITNGHLVPHPTIPGANVMEYLMDYYSEAGPLLEDAMKKLFTQNPTYQVYFIGHSLGGALATLAAATMVQNDLVTQKSTHVYTYGQPRVGDAAFAKAATANILEHYRVVHRNDPIPHTPPRNDGGYSHMSYEVWYDNADMSSYRVCGNEPLGEDPTCSDSYLILRADIHDHTHYFGVEVRDNC